MTPPEAFEEWWRDPKSWKEAFWFPKRLTKEAWLAACAWQREQDATVAWLIGGEPNQSKAIAQGKGKRYQWQRDQYHALADSAREIATAIRHQP